METFKNRLKRALPVFSNMLGRSTPLIRQAIVAGGSAGDHTVAGLKAKDELVSVIHYTAGALPADLTAEFSIVGDATVNNTSTDTSSDAILVTWIAWDAS